MSVKYRRLYTSVGQCYDFNGLSSQAVLLYLLLISKADIDGKMLAIPELIKASCALFINDIKEKDINSILKQLADKGLIIVYQWDDKPILMIKNFREKQEVRKNYESESKYPDPDGSNSITLENTQKNSKVVKSNSEIRIAYDFDSVFARYPKKSAKQKCLDKMRASVKTDEDFANLNKALTNYIALVEEDRAKGFKDRAWKDAPTFFNNWKDFVEVETDAVRAERAKKVEEERQRKLAEAEEAKRQKFLAENPDIAERIKQLQEGK